MNQHEPAAQTAALETLLDTVRDSTVRDLAWLLFSRSLLREQPPLGKVARPFETADEAAAVEAWLLALDRDAQPLREAMAASRPTRLGRYAECLLAYFLTQGPAPRLIAANVALRSAGRTIGECDFLVESALGRRMHWELAVKCYLHVGGDRGALADYVGPNLQDRFDVKLARLLDHQLPLSARDEFASLGHAGPWEAQMFVKGWLFYRWEEGRSHSLRGAPDAVDPLHARGFWVTQGQWLSFAESVRLSAAQSVPQSRAQCGPAVAWSVLPRLAWLAPRRLAMGGDDGEVDLNAAHSLAERLALSGPTMVAAFLPEEGEGGEGDGAPATWREYARGFVVPDDWPQHAEAFATGAYHQR
jgi:hypothetical protein